ncbi:MAG: histidine kinase [Deltaproteobacteria bacterium]|nr:histidine kinase [Deltaproteobacteria bacterium]
MNDYFKSMDQKPFLPHLFHHLFYTFIFAVIIALFFKFIVNRTFWDSLIVATSIGFSACICVMMGIHGLKPNSRFKMILISIIGEVLGVGFGFYLGFRIIDVDLSIFLNSRQLMQLALISFTIGLAITYFFISRNIIADKETLLQEEKINRLDMEKKAVETNLRLLQAQIEPHFLFNTLSNILGLLDSDLENGKTMLKDLIQYLRTTLSKTRDNATTVGGEMEMIRAYLSIFKVRMGDRLQYNIDIPDNIKDISFHPMLIQPLVENAVKHGLEPEIKGGEIRILGALDKDTLRIEITDTGAGLYENSNPGMGIENIRERLKSLYGDKGRLTLKENKPSGVRAIIEVPYASN